MEEIISALKSIPKDVLDLIIFTLMMDGTIEYHRLTEMHIKYLEALRQGQSDRYRELVGKVIDLHIGGKGKLKENLGDLLHYLIDCGEANLTHEDIDKKYKRKRE